MTDCPDGAIRDLLPDLVHDRLGPDVRARVDAHVRNCSDCQQELALLRAMRSLLRRGPVVDVGAIASAIPAYRAPRRAWGGWRAAAAVVLLAVGGTSIAVLQRESSIVRDAGMTAELAIGNPAIDELDDRELSTLLAGLETLEAFPSPDEDRPADPAERAPAGTN